MAVRVDRNRVTLREVAQVSGVSLKTASNVINGSGRMSEETRARVEAVIQRLGYKVNAAARNMSRGRTGFLTLAVPTLTPPYLAELANRVIDTARQHGYSVYVSTYGHGSAASVRDLLQNFNSTVSDGMILSMSETENISPKDLKVDFPLVVVGARTTWGIADHVTPDDRQAGALAASYLYERGARRLAVIGMRGVFDESELLQAEEGNCQLRMRGFIEESRRRGIDVDARLVGDTGHDWTIGRGAYVTKQLLDNQVPFDGMIALNDQLAIGAMSVLCANGITIPRDVQIIGFDNLEEDAYLQIPLTSMDSRLNWVTSTAVKRIISRIGGSADSPKLMTTQSNIIARASTR
ncbi:LacI family DNA-binding transcriptional regulator [Bifidobacterium olomucense]|uniref:Regulatory protein, LacI n=1 Tax=Bifidobacterium olomucense TaxID=2675324 RepID=A0A7Y0EWE0_9BIFI|nr:LacI family DNA-binding transcriptional regulator [Bifidobacterium sp. DSM 109959]NMM97258.1 Regulatory protein, LacI [Bifidobacterium sp. DSM 109959]